MSRYTFTFRKDDIFVEFTTEDKAVVERQFQIWVTSADEYVKAQANKIKGQTVNTLTGAKPRPVTQPQPQAPQVSQQVAAQQYAQNQQQYQSYRTQQSFDQASSLLKTINNIQNENVNVQPQVTQEAMQNSETPTPMPQAEPQIQQPMPQVQENIQQPVQEVQPQQGFESVLEEKIESPETPNFDSHNVDQIFLNLINSKNTKDKFHYLMITAYYLTEFGKQDRFTLKQINSKLMQNVSEVIDHSLLQEAINQGFIELVPDPTGMAQVGEYRLTRHGEDFFAYKI